MKKMLRILMVLMAVSLFALTNSNAQQIVVRVRPHHAIIVRPHRPSPRHVWVAEEWTPSGGAYVYHPGYWVVPEHPGAIWIAGHWRHTRHGFIWIPGHWR